jgi:hypothetical protein
MRSFRQKHLRQRLLAIVMLLGLLLQVQTVLACQMLGAEMEMAVGVHDHHAASHSGSHSHLDHGPDCCCADVAVADRHASADTEAHTEDCCYVSSELTLKKGSSGSEPPMLAPKPPNQEPPEAAIALILAALWPDELFGQQSAVAIDIYADRGAPGTKTYLSTQRLRI